VSLAFLTPAGPVARSPLHHRLEALGARFEERGGWLVASRVSTPEAEAEALRTAVGWADLSHDSARIRFCGIAVGGPDARETIARFCALDLRRVAPGDLLPGSVARTPGEIEVLAADRFLLRAGAAVAEYLWDVVDDAGRHLGGQPVGADAFGEAARA
jgi:sarcosine oxidase gamma subunit